MSFVITTRGGKRWQIGFQRNFKLKAFTLEKLMKISICKLHDESAFDSFTFDTSAFDDEAKFEAKV